MEHPDNVTDDILDFFSEGTVKFSIIIIHFLFYFHNTTSPLYNYLNLEFDFTNEDFTFDILPELTDFLNNEDSDNVSDDLTVSTIDPKELQSLPKTSVPIQTPVQAKQSSINASTMITKTNNIKENRKYSKVFQENEITTSPASAGTIINNNTYEKFIIDQTKRDKKFIKGDAGIPRPVTGYIKNVYAQMYMNSINSADFNNIQNYFSTFMSGPCSFTVQHQLSNDKQYDLPHILNSFSPQLFSHYLLGCYLNFPDMVVKMKGSRMYTSSNGHTKIVIDTDVYCTKMFEVDFDWAPDVEQLSDLYNNMRVTYENNNVKDDKNNDTKMNDSTSSGGSDSSSTKRRTAQLTGVVAPTATNLAAVRRLPLIPTTYVNNMTNQSKMLATPIPLHTTGTMTLYLDKHNCMEHVYINTAQVDDTSFTVPITVTSSTTSNGSYSSSSAGVQLQQQQQYQQLQELQKWQSWKQQQPPHPYLPLQQQVQPPLPVPPSPALPKPSPAPRKRAKKNNALPAPLPSQQQPVVVAAAAIPVTTTSSNSNIFNTQNNK